MMRYIIEYTNYFMRIIMFRAWEGWDATTMKMIYSNDYRDLEDFFTYSQRFEKLMDWTGLYDINNKNIYVDDIVDVIEKDNSWRGVVVDHRKYDGSFRIANLAIHDEYARFSPLNKYIVVGNVFENKELL